MKKLFLSISLSVLLLACDTTFKAEKMITEDYDYGRVVYTTYLVSNLTYSPKIRDSILLDITRKRVVEICKKDSNIVKIGCDYYNNTSCTRRYYQNYKHLKGVEDIYERCEKDHRCNFVYKKSKEDVNQWCLVYPENIKDTIYCK